MIGLAPFCRKTYPRSKVHQNYANPSGSMEPKDNWRDCKARLGEIFVWGHRFVVSLRFHLSLC